ncbi:MAG: RpiB/LacA/LacB family sugar-phosphate isomerase [Bacteroidia bacterium]|nr:RpiB/LacA/LacB family sugar-phosphate isomerase [Bacteroidia bacterium]MDW8088218.1 RpiB/LacA/LacB family sugar-phosphate isomerase [Bacteroidia bacterium]
MRVWLASDHAGYGLKCALRQWLQAKGYEVRDVGSPTADPTDYPLWVHQLAREFPPEGRAILLCGSGNGVCITANRYGHIRAAVAWNSEIARLARAHNDANVLCLPARFISLEEAQAAVAAFLNTPFEGGRHARRVALINP